MAKVTASNFTSAASSSCTTAEHNNNIWEDIERALIRAIRVDPKGLQAMKPRLLHLLHNPASVNNQDNNIKSLYKACGLESDSESDSDSSDSSSDSSDSNSDSSDSDSESESESDVQHAVLEKQDDDDTQPFADFIESELITSSGSTANFCNSNCQQKEEEEEDVDVLADFIESELLAPSSYTANLCNNKEQQKQEGEDLHMLADFIEGDMLQAASCKSTITSSTSINTSSATTTITTTANFSSTSSNYNKLDAADYNQKLELSRQKLRAGYAMQQQDKKQHRSKLISYTDAKQLLRVQSKLSPKKTITKKISNTKITNYTTAKTKMSISNLALQQYKKTNWSN